MLVTLCWWHCCWSLCMWLKLIYKDSGGWWLKWPNRHQHLKVVINTFCLQHPFPTWCNTKYAFPSPWITQMIVDDLFISMTISLFQLLSACQTSGQSKTGTKFTGRFYTISRHSQMVISTIEIIPFQITLWRKNVHFHAQANWWRMEYVNQNVMF